MRTLHRWRPAQPGPAVQTVASASQSTRAGNRVLQALGLALLAALALVLPDGAAAGAGGVTIVTLVHDDGHEPIESVAIGDTVHPWVSVSGVVSVPTGSVTTQMYAGSNCSGHVYREWRWQLSGGVAHVGSEMETIEGSSTYSMRSTYGGNGMYASKDGPCVGFSGVGRPPEYSVEVRTGAGERIDTVVAGEPFVVEVDIVGDSKLPDPTGEVFLHYWKGSCPGSGQTTDTKPLVDGHALFELKLDVPGETHLAAIYDGDSLYLPGWSGCDEPLNVTKATPTVVTAIHDGGHRTVTSAPVGASVHAWIGVTGAATVPTGRVNVDWFPDAACGGVASTAYTELVGGAVDLDALAPPGDVAGTHSFRADYFGDAVYVSAFGRCTAYTILSPTPTATQDKLAPVAPTPVPAGATMVPATDDPGTPPVSPIPSGREGPPAVLPADSQAPSSPVPELGPVGPATRNEPPLWLLLVIALGMVVLGYVAGQRRHARKEVAR